MIKRAPFFIFLLLGLGIFALTADAWAQNIPLFSSRDTGNTTSYSVPVQTVLLLTAFSFLPAALLLMTSFARIIIVLSLLRQALGLQTTPPNLVLIGLALFLTWFIMNPTFEAIYTQAYAPLSEGRITFQQAVDTAWAPLRDFMLAQTRQEDLNLFASLHGKPIPTRAEVPMSVLVPAFAISEIKTGFLVGFMIYLPFIAIDFAVASILTSLGMVMVSPMMFSLPLKLIIFVLADGWALLAASLVASFAGASP
jgi:flagellar biosynthesis protein FliP